MPEHQVTHAIGAEGGQQQNLNDTPAGTASSKGHHVARSHADMLLAPGHVSYFLLCPSLLAYFARLAPYACRIMRAVYMCCL